MDNTRSSISMLTNWMRCCRSRFTILGTKAGKMFIVDDNTGKCSVTNDAENVVRYMNGLVPGVRIFYCDSEGDWGELIHDDGRFLNFGPGEAY